MLLRWLTCDTAKAFKSNAFYNVCTIWKCVFSIYSRWKMWALFCRLKAAVKIKHTHEIHFRLWHVALPAFQTTLVRCAFHWADCLWSFRIQDAKPTVYYFNPCSQTENKRNFTLHGQSVGERNSRKKVLKIDLYLEKLWHHNTIFLSTDGISVWWISKWNIYIFITKYKYKYKTHVYVDVSAYRLSSMWKFKFGWVGKILKK